MQRETSPAARARRVSVAVSLCLAGGGAFAAAALADAAPARAADAVVASSGPHAPSDPSAQLTTSMMPASSPDARPTTTTTTTTTTTALGGKAVRTFAVAHTATTSSVLGVDVSSYQHPNGAGITWSQVKGSGQSFAVVKATESTYYVNPWVTSDAAGARAAGLQVGLYHFARPTLVGGSPTTDAVAEADAFARQVQAVGGAQLPPTLDLEVTGGLTPTQLAAWTGQFLTRVRADTGREPMIYTGPYFWMDNVGSTAFSSYPLWEADYTTDPAPMSFGGWSSWQLWQYSDGAYFSPPPVYGISAYVDRDRYAGFAGPLSSFASASTGNVAPYTGTASPADYPNGMLVQLSGTPEVYEMAGLAPVYLPSFADVGSMHPIRQLTAAQFYSLRSTPLDGTWLIAHDTDRAYRVVGGAPVYLTSFAPFPGGHPFVWVGQADMDRAGQPGVYSHLDALPMDGTFIGGAEKGTVYRIAGGAPVYVSNWAYFGGLQPTTEVNQASIDRASPAFDHLNYIPADGTMIADPTAGTYWTMSYGSLQQVSNTGQPFVVEGHTAILYRGLTGILWSHLR